MEEQVNHPRHYNHGNIECIDAMLSAFGTEAVKNFCRLSAFKYLWRAGLKDELVQDLDKAIWYIQKEIKLTINEQKEN